MAEVTSALVVVASTRAANGGYTDSTGPILVQWLRDRGYSTPDPTVVADSDIPAYLDDLLRSPHLPQIVLTTGGTGISPSDQTVASVRPHLTHELPGLPAAVWRRGEDSGVPTALLSGGIAGVVRRTFIMTLPGSTGGVRDGIAVLDPLLDHLISQLKGVGDHE